MRYLIVLIALSEISSEAWAEPVVPKQLLIASEVGSVGGNDGGKVVVTAGVMVNPGQKVSAEYVTIEVTGVLTFGEPLSLDGPSLTTMIGSLATIIDKPNADFFKETETTLAPKWSIANKEENGKRVVRITQKPKNNPLRQSNIALDLDNSETLLKVLKRAQGVHEWMDKRVAGFRD
jgi:hypothetical protein